MNRNNIIYKFLLLILIVSGCDEKEKIVPLQGDIVGFVSLYNEDGSLRDDHSNVTVTLNEKYTVLTNEIGKFEFKNIEAGTYIQLPMRKMAIASIKNSIIFLLVAEYLVYLAK